MFLQLEDIAVIPTQLNPALNHVECIVEEKPSDFELHRVKKIFPHICWAFWFFSLIAGYFVTVVFVQLFQERKKDVVVKGTLTFSLVVFYVGFIFGILVIAYDGRKEGYKWVYPFIHLLSMIFTYMPFGYVYCRVSLEHKNQHLKWKLAHVYPSSFVMIHSILWMMVGMITEPHWAIPVVASHAAAVFLFCLLLGFYHSPDRDWDKRDKTNLGLLLILSMSVISLTFFYFLVGSLFFNDESISSVIPFLLIVILGLLYKHFKRSSQEPGKESRNLLSNDVNANDGNVSLNS